ncbi:gamma-glutamylcyclotransferase family protein [Saccharospirillum salsuginis]|uniref:Gamma-glutamylcyclotransferase n=1 Tax=Saccharospirillum salsuginis TaxID=418750 RepID=A0A918KI75_9GAMM|nr:gamma-glutamylcyclotransferase family protein [Saccharospirillum salsuginis]GGX62090.1 gamma-glutamylcyclotransferase [Saccharospirillum salsuginis]
MHCLFGYGSLICADSRSRTGISGDAIPVEVTGIARRWSVPVPSYRATAVGAHQDPDSHCNGVIFLVDDDNLSRFDTREQGYRRLRIDWTDVKPAGDHTLPDHYPLWAYVGHHTDEPQPDRPIMQTYLDVILNGCLGYGETFARRFLQTTTPWQHLVDDRHAPNYPRAMRDTSIHPIVDGLLHTELPELITGRQTYTP